MVPWAVLGLGRPRHVFGASSLCLSYHVLLCFPCRNLRNRLGLLLHRWGCGGSHAGVHLAGLLLRQEAEAVSLLSSPRCGQLPEAQGPAGVFWTTVTTKRKILSAFVLKLSRMGWWVALGAQGKKVNHGPKPPCQAGWGRASSPPRRNTTT